MRILWSLVVLIAVTGSAYAQERPNVVIMLADNVVGRAWLRYWPLDVFGLLGRSDTGATPATD